MVILMDELVWLWKNLTVSLSVWDIGELFLFVDIGSEDKYVLIDVMSDNLMSRKVVFHVIIFDIINVISNCYFRLWCRFFNLPPTLLMLIIFSICYSKYVVILEILLSCSISFDENLCVVSFSTLLSSERCSFSNLRLTGSFTILFDSSYCVSLNWLYSLCF